ncbi:MAG: hypothetical protein U5K43_05410 [Halofilum sp. (in: g-proteobacteria)]|nr:hypothetical protein [Halofilum sp. (in: g-proteobacteria)]
MATNSDKPGGLMTDLGRVLTDWRPEDDEFWRSKGYPIAQRNLWISIPCLLLAFCVWLVWSAVGYATQRDRLHPSPPTSCSG